MFSGSGIKVVTARVWASSASRATFLAGSMHASRVVVPFLLAEVAAFALAAGSGKIPEFLFTAARALLTF